MNRLFSLMLALVFGSLASAETPFTMIVLDPLSADLACPCVKGYAQRDYKKLAAHIAKETGRPVDVAHADSLADALKKKTEGKCDLIIGKESVVRVDAKSCGFKAVPLAALTGLDGKTTMTGLFVVHGADPALSVADLKDYKIVFGASKADEKHIAAFHVMKDLGLEIPMSPQTCGTCTEGALLVVEGHKANQKIATVISSYAQPLLEGCGTVKKGELKVIAKTAEVPFIVAFATDKLQPAEREAVKKALLSVSGDADLCKIMETKGGFIPLGRPIDAKKK
jgi:ABC-type phosphate/phosphonate transport system substrate-binding protein